MTDNCCPLGLTKDQDADCLPPCDPDRTTNCVPMCDNVNCPEGTQCAYGRCDPIPGAPAPGAPPNGGANPPGTRSED